MHVMTKANTTYVHVTAKLRLPRSRKSLPSAKTPFPCMHSYYHLGNPMRTARRCHVCPAFVPGLGLFPSRLTDGTSMRFHFSMVEDDVIAL